MLRFVILCWTTFCLALAEPPVSGVKPSNVLGSSDQHASFSFVRPGLTQTAFAFSGPSSHQSFSSSIGNPHLAHKVLPSVAQALAYRNPGLGAYPLGPIANGYANAPVAAPTFAQAPLPYQTQVDPASALAYYQQLQQIQQHQLQQIQQPQQPQLQSYPAAAYQAQLAQLFALRQAQLQAQAQPQAHIHAAQPQQVPEQIQLQQEQQQQQAASEQPQNLLGVAYSAAPSVAHVKVAGNGYKFDF